jgi:hypothetical protein
MRFTGAVVTEQGITFGAILVAPGVTQSSTDRDQMEVFGKATFGRIPIVLVENPRGGDARCWGRADIVNFLQNGVLFEMIP